jgi:glycerol-3-phosphate dehydrogenase subunit C
MREGSLEPPIRHPLAWEGPDFADRGKIEAELRRVFEICHSCRRCFNLCDSFPRLFDLIDQSATGELDAVDAKNFAPVVDACTLCDMCFMTKCPYVPPHEFNLDFPHLMLRYRAAGQAQGKVPLVTRELARTDRNGHVGCKVAPLANWTIKRGNKVTRPLLEYAAGIHREAALPRFHGHTLSAQVRTEPLALNREAPAFGRKAAIFATCYGNYHDPAIGLAARAVLARNGVETEVVYPGCCGMPQFEHGDLADVAKRARQSAAVMGEWIERGYDVIALLPSCALMLKFEWPLLLPDDKAVRRLADASFDACEYVVDIARGEGLAEGAETLDGPVVLHIPCHARAQNMGRKAEEMLALIPGADLRVIERCSGHGGAWGVGKEHFEVALKVGRPVARQAAAAAREDNASLASECPLAGEHILQGMEKVDNGARPKRAVHPIELLARAYGIDLPG